MTTSTTSASSPASEAATTASTATPVAAADTYLCTGKIDLIKHRWWYLGISALLLVPGIFFIVKNMQESPVHSPVKLGIDFVGGTMLEYGSTKPISQTQVLKAQALFNDAGYTGTVVQVRSGQSLVDAGKQAKKQLLESDKNTQANSEATKPEKTATPDIPVTSEAGAPVASSTTASDQTSASLPKVGETTPAPSNKLTKLVPPTEAVPPSVTPPAIPPAASASPPEPVPNRTTATFKTKAMPLAHMAVGEVEVPAPTDASFKSILSIRTKTLSTEAAASLQSQLTQQLGDLTLLQKNTIGPTLASELLQNAVIALVLAYLLIMGYLTLRFQLDYALCAMCALVHDSVFMIGTFAMLGALFHTEVDSLFITALLTVVGFSVHDTIVVFDRLRENSRLLFTKKLPFAHIANLSINQTLARSINTSVTALLPLIALYFLGGSTVKDFVLTMIIGIIVGTFSSIFIASLLLAWWRDSGNKSTATVRA